MQWRPSLVCGQLRLPGCAVDLSVPDIGLDAAQRIGAASLVLGVARPGGSIPISWWQTFEAAANLGLDVVAGMHERLADNEDLSAAARRSGARLIDVRVPPPNLPVGTGRKRSGKRLLTVGTDCAVGKKYTALALQMSLQEAGLRSTFRATGQTGIMIAGEGIPIDAIVADFIAGAAEILSPPNDDLHWDVIEGQGSLFHPAYSGVSLGLLHGSQPDAFVVCHDATRKSLSDWEHYPLPTVGDCIAAHEAVGRLTNPSIRCIGVSVNTSGLSASERRQYLAGVEAEVKLPCVDPIVDGCRRIINVVREQFSHNGK